MPRDRLAVVMVFGLLVGATAGFHLLLSGQEDSPSTQSVETQPASAPASDRVEGRKVLASLPALGGDASAGPSLGLLAMPQTMRFKGISLGLHSSDPGNPYEKYIDEIAAMGANTVSVIIAAYQENASSCSMFVEWRKTPPEARIRELIAYAHGKGLEVIVMPLLLLENPRAGEWRGKIAPTDWDAWWDRYSDFVLQYARLAESAKAEAFLIGSELVSTEDQTDRWRGLIKEARKCFSGLLSYSANWDHYEAPRWWNELDMIGMTSYHDMNTDKRPTVEQLVEAWKPIKAKILAWRATIGLPLLFTEVGWPNQETCANQPWNYYGAVDKPDPVTQANCFEAFFRTWADEKDVAGVLVWEWRNHPGMVGGPEDTTYIPCGKPAEDVIARYYKLIPSRLAQPHAMLPAKAGQEAGAARN